MANALHPMSEAPAVEPAATRVEFETDAGRSYQVRRHEDQTWHYEIAADEQGELYQQGFPIRFALGSGRRGRSYLIDRDGFLTMSPIAWYSNKSRFDLSPGYTVGDHQRFDREATDRCLTCHSGLLTSAPLTGNDSLRREPPWFLEHGVGCERCHGPGQQHVAWRRDGAAEGQDTIVNPAGLEPAQRDAVCAQCHLQGAYQVLRSGRWHSDFRPGESLSQTWLTYVQGDGVGEVGTLAVSQFEQMLESACYVESGRALGCTSCHDPHQAAPQEPQLRGAYYRQRCLDCHEDASACSAPADARAAVNDACADCHMASLAAEDIPHTTQSDHRILKRGGAPSSRVASSDLALFLLGEEEPPLAERRCAQALILASQAESQGSRSLAEQAIPELTRQLEANPQDVDVLDSLALCEALLGRTARSLELWETALQLQPQRRTVMQSAAQVLTAQGRLSEAAELRKRLADDAPWRAGDSFRYSRNAAQLGLAEEAWAAAKRAIQIDPSRSEFLLWGAELARGRGLLDQARQWRTTAERLQALPQ